MPRKRQIGWLPDRDDHHVRADVDRLGTAATYIGGGIATLGGAITAGALAGTLPTGGLSDLGLPLGLGLGVGGGTLALGGMARSSDFAVNGAEALGDCIGGGGPVIAPGTPAAEPSLADVIPAR